MSTETLLEADVAIQLKRKRANERILKALKSELEDMFPDSRVEVGMGRDEVVKLRHWGDKEERKVRRLVTHLGGKISRR